MESCGLVFRVIQFGKTVGDFAPGDEQLEPIAQFRRVIVAARQRRDFHRIGGDKSRSGQFLFDGFLEQRHLQRAQAGSRRCFHAARFGELR